MPLLNSLPALWFATAPRLAEPPATWPTLATLIAARGAGRASLMAWAKTGWRQWASRPHRAPLLRVLAQQPAWAHCFARQPNYFRCAISHFIDRRLGAAQRIHAMAEDLVAATSLLGPALADRIAQGEWLRLWSLNDDVHLCLGLNDVSIHEGLWALALRDSTGRRLYYLSFSFHAPQALLVSTVQGPTAQDDDARALIRQLTKQAEGLRPQALLMAALRAASAAWRIGRLAGIAPEHHIKGRWNLRDRRLRFDYAAFWQEQGGQRAADGHWALPTTQPVRAPQDTPPQKRAMYRRRQAMLAAMDQAMGQLLAPGDAAARRLAV